jgi:hypothetical protein
VTIGHFVSKMRVESSRKGTPSNEAWSLLILKPESIAEAVFFPRFPAPHADPPVQKNLEICMSVIPEHKNGWKQIEFPKCVLLERYAMGQDQSSAVPAAQGTGRFVTVFLAAMSSGPF